VTEDIGGRVSGATRPVGVIGWPVSGSLSPVIHNAAFAALGLDLVYVALAVPPGELPRALTGLTALGFVGANVTMPYKTEASRLIADLSEDAERLQAVNTIVCAPGGMRGHNTDAPGFERFLRADAGFEPAGRSALVFGGGGAARACALALARGGLASLILAVRDEAKAAGVRSAIEGFDTEVEVVGFESARSVAADLVVNATPLGADGEELPVPRLGAGTLVVDLLYGPSVTPLLSRARACGAMAFGGLGLLIQQAALSFELWTGRSPSLDVMSAAALSALAGSSADGGPLIGPGAASEDPDRSA
jgi:shikimate dehydrogenase